MTELKNKLMALLRSAGVWINAMLLAVFPFTDQIMQGVNDYLPSLAQYLPANIYKWVGLAVVVANIARAAHRAHKAAKEAANA